MSEHPSLRPVPIKTKGQCTCTKLRRWITYVRWWNVVDDWTYQLPNGGPKIVIPKGFLFDGASIPKMLWFLLSPTGLLLIPGLIHDYAYRYDYLWAINDKGEAYQYQYGNGREYWDLLFKDVATEVNQLPALNALAWFALVLGGKSAWNDNRLRNEADLVPNLPLAPDLMVPVASSVAATETDRSVQQGGSDV